MSRDIDLENETSTYGYIIEYTDVPELECYTI